VIFDGRLIRSKSLLEIWVSVDIALDFAIKNHWEKYGIKEKRNKFCYPEMTQNETACYLKRLPDVSFTSLNDPKAAAKAEKAAKKAGKPFNPVSDLITSNPVRAARMHYDTYGHYERGEGYIWESLEVACCLILSHLWVAELVSLLLDAEFLPVVLDG
jgi:hypothetical protein